jgi:hypothetical protein
MYWTSSAPKISLSDSMVAFAIVAFNSPMDEFAAFYRSKNL